MSSKTVIVLRSFRDLTRKNLGHRFIERAQVRGAEHDADKPRLTRMVEKALADELLRLFMPCR
jgi:hypothetical protein